MGLKDLKTGFSLIVGIQNVKSSKTGKDFEVIHLVTKINDSDNFVTEQVWNNEPHKYPINLGDAVQFYYSGNGNFKRIAQVIKQS